MELRLLLHLLWRRRRLLALVAAGVFIPLFLMTVLVETQYVSSAKVYLFKSPTKDALLARLNLEASSPMPSDGMSDQEKETFVTLALTRPVVTPVIDKLHLTRKRKSLQLIELLPLVRPLIRALAPDIMRRALPYEEFTHKSVIHTIFPRPYLDVGAVEDADILEFSSSADSIELAVAIANAAAKSFIEAEQALRRKDTTAVSAALDKEIPLAREAYKAALAELGTVREENTVVDVDAETEKLAERYQATLTDRDQARLLRIKTQGQRDSLLAQRDKTPEFTKSSEQFQRSSLIDSVKLTLRDLYLDLANTKTRYTPEHPAVKDIENKIAEAKKILDSESKKIFGSETLATDPVHTYLAQRLADAESLLVGVRSQEEAYALVLEALSREIAAFSRKNEAVSLVAAKAEAAETYYNSLILLDSQAKAGRSVDLGVARLVEPAVIPGKIDDYMRPKLSLFSAASLFLAVFLSFLAVLTAEYLDDSLRGEADAARAGTPFLGEVPAGPEAARREALRLLRRVLAGLGGPPGTATVLAGVAENRGLADLAADLAEVVARSGRETLLIEADFDAPALAARHGLAPGPGLAEAVRDRSDPAEAIRATSVPGLSLLVAGEPGTDPDLLVESPVLAELLTGAADGRRRCFVTASAVLASGDAAILGRLTGGVALVAEWGRTDVQDLREAVRRLGASGTMVFGVVLANAPADRPEREWRRALQQAKQRISRRRKA